MASTAPGWTTPLVIEAAICPYRPGQPVYDGAGMVEESKACLSAGAAIVHHHHDMRFGAQDAIREMVDMARAVKRDYPDALLYPDFLTGPSVAEWIEHIEPLSRENLLDLIPIDPGGAFSGQLDDAGLPHGANTVRFTFNDANVVLKTANELGRPTSIGVFEPFNLRWALAQRTAGALPAGSIAKLYLAGDYSLVHIGKRALNYGLPPTPESVDAYVRMLQGSNMPWQVGVPGEAILNTPVARYAIERGGHVRVGTEDAAGRTDLSNAQTVEAVVELAREIGRPVAQGDAAREALGFTRTAVPA